MLQQPSPEHFPESNSDRTALYSAIASRYDATYEVPSHRRLYDRLAWEYISAIPLPENAHVVDAGCGAGRWMSRWLERGCRVTGIEQAPGMIEALALRDLGPAFTLLETGMEAAPVETGSADLVLALGSVQYSADPAAMIGRFASWLRPGGTLCVYADSLVALVIELIQEGRHEEAQERLRTRRGLFRQGDHAASLALYDRATMQADFIAAGLIDVRCHGLAVGAGAIGRAGSTRAMQEDEETTMQRERVLSADQTMADIGLHILSIGTKPGRS